MDELKQLLRQQNEMFQTMVRQMAALQPGAAGPSQPVPQPPPLCLEGDMETNYDFFERNWINYAKAIGLDKLPAAENSTKVSYLLSVIGFDALKKYFNFQLTEQQLASPQTALAAIKSKVVRPRNINLDLLEYFSAKQEELSIDEYVVKLRAMAKHCQFGDLEDRFLIYKIVSSNKWPHLRKKLTTTKDVTLDKAIDECRLEELFAGGISELSKEVKGDVNKIRSKMDKKCKFCGGRHPFEKGACPAYGQKCKGCKGKNHFLKMCKKKKKVKQLKVDDRSSTSSSDLDTTLDSDDSDFEREIGQITSSDSSQELVTAKVHLKVNDKWKKTNCVLDTGANTSIIGYNWLRNLLGIDKPVLLPTKYKLRGFGGSPIPSLGSVKIPVRHAGRKFKLVFQVVDVHHRPLLSASVCEALGLVQFCGVRRAS